ncbi:hypothetical protein CDAR_265881 [Caerostris darwini]|uniref:Uncharacterized protein n=1 Tax=Caerostris darwini TaxID=1538125 RepID=A0AAV4V7D1_9ARAC|nr:hypothetical protein CDAR_265881 [Caerostris darwini]
MDQFVEHTEVPSTENKRSEVVRENLSFPFWETFRAALISRSLSNLSPTVAEIECNEAILKAPFCLFPSRETAEKKRTELSVGKEKTSLCDEIHSILIAHLVSDLVVSA